MTDDGNPFQEGIFMIDPRDVPLVYASGITATTQEAMDLMNVEPNGRPCTTLTLAALRIIAFKPYPVAEKTSFVLMLSIEALAGIIASAEAEMEMWDDATRTRFRWLVDQHTAAAREAKAHRKPGEGQ